MDIEKLLFDIKDEKIGDFNARLIPNIPRESIIGIRTPELRKLAKKLKKENPEFVGQFMRKLPHKYYEENQLHAFFIELIKDYAECIAELEKFLPYIDNWATCDSLSPKIFKQFPKEVHKKALEYMKSGHTYTIRYGIGILLSNFLDEYFTVKDLEIVSKIKSDEYYVNMMIAWYFSFALIKHYDESIIYIENRLLDDFIHKKSIQKAVESTRIDDKKKVYLKTLR